MNDRETSDRVTQASNELYDNFGLFALPNIRKVIEML